MPHEDRVILTPSFRAIAEQAIKAKYPFTDVARFTHTASVVDKDMVVRYERNFTVVATPEEPFTRTMLEMILVRMSGTNVISTSRSQRELSRIPPSRNNI